MKENLVSDARYKEWLKDLSTRYRGSQIKAARSVNREMITFYWSLGRDIVQMDAENVYGSGFYEKLSSDLKGLIPDSRGLSPRNLRYMKRLFLLDISIYETFPQIVEKFPQIGEDLVNTLPGDLKETKNRFATTCGRIQKKFRYAICWNFAPTWGRFSKHPHSAPGRTCIHAAKAPVSISEYQISHLLKDDYRRTLPTIEELERELSNT